MDQIWIGVLVTLVAVTVLLMLWCVPKWQVSLLGYEAKERFDKENEARKTLATAVGGFALVVSLYSTAMTLRMTSDGQITDRYTKAIDQLGALAANGDARIEVRLGGIYALVRIARDSSRDASTIQEVLSAYLRQNAPARRDDECSDTAVARADFQAVISYLGERSSRLPSEQHPLDLRAVSLCRYSLSGGTFGRVLLTGSDLRRSKLRDVNLRGAGLEDIDLRHAQLEGADLSGANLSHSLLSDANLQDTKLIGAVLTGVTFTAARLVNTDFSNARLDGAILYGVDLEKTKGLCSEQVSRIERDGRTRLPKGIPSCQ